MATKSLPTPYFAFDRLGSPAWAPRDYAAFAREGFMGNAILYRSVRMIAEAAASVPLLLYSGDEEIPSHPLFSLIARPNATSTAPDLFEALYGFLLVSGNAYLEALPLGQDIRELHTLRPDRMKVVPGPGGWPEAYDYTADGKIKKREPNGMAQTIAFTAQLPVTPVSGTYTRKKRDFDNQTPRRALGKRPRRSVKQLENRSVIPRERGRKSVCQSRRFKGVVR